MSKAWIVFNPEIDGDDGNTIPVHAETRGKARAHAASEWDMTFWESIEYNIKVARAPEFDNRPFNDYEMLMNGRYGWCTCSVCSRRIEEPSNGDLDVPFHTRWTDGDESEVEIAAHPYGERGIRCGDCHANNWTMEDERRAWQESRR